MAKVTIGDKDYIVRELNFVALEKTWATLQTCLVLRDPILAVGSALDIFAAALQEEPEFKREDFGIDTAAVLEPDELDTLVSQFLKRRLKAGQIGGVQVALDQVIEEAGLRPTEGEGMSPGTESPGTATSPQSSHTSLLEGAREEAGTE